MAKGGATIWARKTIDSEVFKQKPAQWFKIWFFLVNKVNHKDNGKFKRGEAFTNYAEIMTETNGTKHQVDQFIRWGKKEHMLTTRKTTRGMYVKVLNYNRYQTLDNYKNDKPHELKTKQKRNENDTIHKNDKNVKNDKKPTSAETGATTPFDMTTELKKLDDNPRRDLNIIGFYFEERKTTFENREQFNTALRRHLRAAKDLKPFTDKQLNFAMREAKRKHSDVDWTLETLIKILTK